MLRVIFLLFISTSCFAQIDTTNDLYRRNKELIDYIRLVLDSAKARPLMAEIIPIATGINTRSFLSADVSNANAVANTIADVTGLSFSVTSGVTYRFKFFIVFTTAATTTGSRWSINGPATTILDYQSSYSLTATSRTFNEGLSAYNVPAASNASAASTGSNIAVIEGIIKPSANGTVIARFASEVLSSAITAKGTRSYVEFQPIN